MGTKRAKKLVVTCGLVGLMMFGLAGCKKEAEPVTTTAAPIETIMPTEKQELNDVIDETKAETLVIEDYTPKEQESIEAEMESISNKTEIDVNTGELIVLPDEEELPDELKEVPSMEDNNKKAKDSIRGMYAEGSMSYDDTMAEIDWWVDSGSFSKEEGESLKAEIKEMEASNKPAPTKPAETKPQVQETQPQVQETQPQVQQPVETEPQVQEPVNNDMSADEQAAAEYWAQQGFGEQGELIEGGSSTVKPGQVVH